MTCQNAADEIRTGPTALGYVSLLSYPGIISRFGRQARLGERGDSGLTAYRRSEFATLDKTRQKCKTPLGRFITSPRRSCRPPLASLTQPFLRLIFGDRPHVAWGQAPKSVLKMLNYFDVIRRYRSNGRK